MYDAGGRVFFEEFRVSKEVFDYMVFTVTHCDGGMGGNSFTRIPMELQVHQPSLFSVICSECIIVVFPVHTSSSDSI